MVERRRIESAFAPGAVVTWWSPLLQDDDLCSLPAPWAGKTYFERFIEKVAVTDDPNDCWEWAGARYPNGYGAFARGHGRGPTCAHRAAYQLFVGPIPGHLEIDHLCRNKPCV